jgi:hypothetical protein
VGQGACSPCCCPCYVCTPCARLNAPRSPRARLYPPALICTSRTHLVLICTVPGAPFIPPVLVQTPHPPLMLVHTLLRSFVLLPLTSFSFVPSLELRSYPLHLFEPSCTCSYSPHSPRARSFSFVLSPGLHLYPLRTFVPPLRSPHCCHCAYTFTGSLICVRPPCAWLPLCGTLTVTE